MPLPKNFRKTKKGRKKAFQELMHGQVGPAREKGIRTLMRKHGISYEEARRRMAAAIMGGKRKRGRKRRSKR